MKTLIPIVLLVFVSACDTPKVKKHKELLTAGYWTCSQTVYDKDKNKVGKSESLVQYLPTEHKPPHHAVTTSKINYDAGLRFTMVVTSTWDLESSKDSISLSEDLKTFELRNTIPRNLPSWDLSARMKLKERLLLSLREEDSASYEIKELTGEKLVISTEDDEIICNHPSSVELNDKWNIVEL